MPKPYYAEYVNHILRFYFRYDGAQGFKNDADKLNYKSAESVVGNLPEEEKNLLRNIYSSKSINLQNNIAAVAPVYRKETKSVWSLVSTVTSKIAKERGLI